MLVHAYKAITQHSEHYATGVVCMAEKGYYFFFRPAKIVKMNMKRSLLLNENFYLLVCLFIAVPTKLSILAEHLSADWALRLP